MGLLPNQYPQKKCKLNPGVLDGSGNQIQYPARIWVDDTLIVAVGVFAMKMALAAVIEAIFTVMGEPDLSLRQCPLAMDKWQKLVVAETQSALHPGPTTCFHNCILLLHLLWHKTKSCWKNCLLSSRSWQRLFLPETSAHFRKPTKTTRVLSDLP